ncbi:MAG: hypothetical protein PGN13_16130 [Patulibacter minatonensis]
MPDPALLTVQHRAAQLAVRAAAARDLARVFPLWRGDEASFRSFIEVAVPIVTLRHQTSGALAGAYYQQLRREERPGGKRLEVPQADLNVDALKVSLYTTGRNMTDRAIAAGLSPQAAIQAALVRVTGTVTRYTLSGGRDTLVEAVRDDPRAEGYERIIGSEACAFCQDLAGTSSTDDFSAHDHCGCTAAPVWTP